MNHCTYNKTIAMLLVPLLALLVCGCGNHKKNQAVAVAKWKAARNNIAMDLANKQMENGQLDQAITTISDTLVQSPEMIDGWILLSQLYQQKDMPANAEKCLNKALSIRPDYPEANYQMGTIKEITGNSQEALEHYQTALKTAPDNINYILAEAQLLSANGQEDQALAALLKQINLGRNSTGLYITTGNIYLNKNEYNRAISLFKDALKKSPDNKLAADKLCYTLMKSGKYQEAAETIKEIQITQDRKEDKQLLLALGDCYLYTNQYIMSQRTYETLIRDLGPKNEYLIRLAQVTIARNDLDRAENSCVRILQSTPDNEEARLLLAIVYLKKQNYDQSRQISEAVLESNENSILAWCILGRSLSSLGQLDEAEACYLKAQDISPEDALTNQLLKEVEQLRLSEQSDSSRPILK